METRVVTKKSRRREVHGYSSSWTGGLSNRYGKAEDLAQKAISGEHSHYDKLM